MCVCAHWVNIYEEAVVFLIWREPMHVVQQHRVSVVKVRVGDEDRRVWRYSNKNGVKHDYGNTFPHYTDKRGSFDSLWRQLLTFRRPDCLQGQKPSLGV